MKKILVMMVFVFGMMVSWVGEAEAHTCPTGFTPMHINMDVGGCPYAVELCVKCSVTGYTASSVAVVGFTPIVTDPACDPEMTFKEVCQYIETYVTNPDFYYTYVCTLTNVPPPCPSQSVEIELYHYNCWQIELIEYFGEETLHYYTCDDAYCLETITWCYDANNNEYVRTQVSKTQVGEPDCELEAHEITIPTIVGNTSGCFINPTVCDD